MTAVKICGLTTIPDLDAAVEAGADYVGFVHFEPSPRHVRAATLEALTEHVSVANKRYGRKAQSVVLVVNPDDDVLDMITFVPAASLIQFHGSESPVVLKRARDLYFEGHQLIKALPVGTPGDLLAGASYAEVADHLMFDAKPPSGSDRPGGHGAAFDWSLLQRTAGIPPASAQTAFAPADRDGPAVRGGRGRPRSFGDLWFLAGGLTPGNVVEAIRVTGAPVVDVSSGVERAPGVKDPALITAFIEAVRAHDAAQQEQP